jgi:hypothetical protein
MGCTKFVLGANTTWTNTLSYDKKIGDKINGVIGTELLQNQVNNC